MLRTNCTVLCASLNGVIFFINTVSHFIIFDILLCFMVFFFETIRDKFYSIFIVHAYKRTTHEYYTVTDKQTSGLIMID